MVTKSLDSNLALCFVVYNSDVNFFVRLRNFIDAGHTIYLYDNSPSNTFYFLKKFRFNEFKNFHYYTSGKNVGLSIAFNSIFMAAHNSGFNYALYFDQDTNFDFETISYVNTYVNNHITIDYLMIGLYNQSSNSLFNFDIIDTTHVISSGTLFNLKLLDYVGWFDTNFFVDGVDYSMCLKALNNSIPIGLFKYSPSFDHNTLQNGANYLNLFGMVFFIKKYSFDRILGVIKSHFILIIDSFFQKKYKFSFKTSRVLICFLLKQFNIRILLFFK